MATVRPLRGLRFDAARVGDVGSVIAPPYDVIAPVQQDTLYARSPHNVVRLILPRESDRAASAARTLEEWVRSGILVRDGAPAVYRYAQIFTLADGSPRRREGIICRLVLEDFARGVVRPHERTLPGPKADRLAILRATGAYLSPIFGLYAGGAKGLDEVLGPEGTAPPVVDVRDGDAQGHALWCITAPDAIARVAEALAPRTIVIADGHHRYETGLTYRRDGGPETILAFLADMESEGIVILPTHRLVRPPLRLPAGSLEAALHASFAVEPLAGGAVPRPAGVIDVLLPDRRLRLRPGPTARAAVERLSPPVRALDVAILHAAILEPMLGVEATALDFTHEDEEAAVAVANGHAAAAFLLNPPTIEQICAVCGAGELMPEKSTYFYPKVATGLVLDLVGPRWL